MSTASTTKDEFIAIAGLNEINELRGLTVRLAQAEIALFKLGGNIYAFDGRCPHRGGSLGAGTIENGTVFCPLHGWQFDIKTGACLDHPERPAICLPVRVVDGQIQVQLRDLPDIMKSAYELAMERLSKGAPTVKLTDEQKKQIAELDSIYAAKIAEREIFLQGQIGKAIETGEIEAIQQIEKQIASERRRFQGELEEKKEQVRHGQAS